MTIDKIKENNISPSMSPRKKALPNEKNNINRAATIGIIKIIREGKKKSLRNLLKGRVATMISLVSSALKKLDAKTLFGHVHAAAFQCI